MNFTGARLAAVILCSSLLAAGPAGQKKDYLSSLEADKIRDAETPSERIKLFLQFADDRLKKFEYELEHPSVNQHEEQLNAMLNAYVGCVDDATDLMELAVEKQQGVRKGIDEMAARTKEFMTVLEKILNSGAQKELYQDTLADAIEGTRDAMNEAEKAKKKVSPPPIRRKPN